MRISTRTSHLVFGISDVLELPVDVVPGVEAPVDHGDAGLAPVLLLQVLDRERDGADTVPGQRGVGARRADERAPLLRRRRRRGVADQLPGRDDGAVGSGIHRRR